VRVSSVALFAAMDSAQLFAQFMNSPLDQPAVHFQLLFTRPAHADTGLDARQVRPHPF
jgi:hypothetical protein